MERGKTDMNKDDLTLYGITEEMEALEQLLEMDEGEIKEDWERLEGELLKLLNGKVDATCGYVQKLKDMVEAAKAQKKRLDDFIKSKENKIDRLGEYVQFCLEKTGRDKFTGELYEMKVRKPSKVLLIDDEKNIPLEFTESIQTIKIDKASLKKWVQAGNAAEGIRLVDGKKSVMFKLRAETKKKAKDESKAK